MNRAAGALLTMTLALNGALTPQAAVAHAQITTTVQFDREIVHVLDTHCVMCHQDAGLAFPLITYEQTYTARWQIRQDALARHMAPWAAVAGFGDFVNDNSLTQREIDFLASWAESFGPRNDGGVYSGVAADPATPKVVQAHTQSDRWMLGKPDLLLSLPAHSVPPRPADTVERTTLDLKLKAERWLTALEYQPGDRRVVHSAVFSVLETGQWLGGWTPWRGFADLPQGLAYRLPAGSHIVAEVHYYGASEPILDAGSLGLHFSAQPSSRVVSDLTLEAKPRATLKLDSDLVVLALQPTLRPGLQSIEVRARTPAGATQILLFARDISTAWPTPYIYRNPVALPKGTELTLSAHYAPDVGAAADGLRLTVSAYGGASLPAEPPAAPPASVVIQRFKLTGTVKSVDAAKGRLVVQHGDIPGFMGAMTMSYGVGQREDLKKIRAGDQIRSDVVSGDTEAYLENIAVTRQAP
jgi:Cu/Ag efflux protein CusF